MHMSVDETKEDDGGQLIDDLPGMRNCIYWKLPLFLVQHRRILSGDIRNISVSILSRRKVLRRMRQKHLILILETRKEKGSLRF